MTLDRAGHPNENGQFKTRDKLNCVFCCCVYGRVAIQDGGSVRQDGGLVCVVTEKALCRPFTLDTAQYRDPDNKEINEKEKKI